MTSDLLTSRLSAVRGKHTVVAAATGAALALALVIAWTGITMWLDWHVPRGLPLWARVSSLALELVAVVWLIATRIVRPYVHAPDDEDVALMVEHEFPDLSTRLIASVQLTRPEALADLTGGRAVVAAMVRQTEALTEKISITDVVKTRTLNKTLGAAAGAILVATALFLWGQPASFILLQRAFLANPALPTKTHLDSVPGDLRVALGDALKIQARVSGHKPTWGTLEITYASGRTQEIPMEREGSSDTYSVTLDAVQESFKYSINVYDAFSEIFPVTALERPAIADIECVQIYPAYTGLGAVPCAAGELALLKGSRLQVKVLSSKPVRQGASPSGKSNYILPFVEEKTGHSENVPLIRSSKNLSELTADMTVPFNLNAISIHLVDTDDLESKDTAVYPVEMLPDRPPTVRILTPDRKEVLETSIAKVSIGFLAEDDFMLGKMTLQYKVDEGQTQSIALELPPKTKTLRAHYLWDLTRVAAPSGQPSLEGSVVEFWLEVEDTNNITGPGRGSSEHFAVRVVTPAAKLAELLAKTGDTVTLIKGAKEAQDQTSDKLSTEINEIPKNGSTPPPPRNKP